MADLIIKPASTSDSFKMKEANSSPNTVLTVEGQTDSGVATAGRVIYGKGVNETLGTTSYDASTDTQTIDLATGTFFDVEMSAKIDDWKILHLPATGIIAAWVVRLKNHSSPVVNLWAGHASSTYDNSGTWSTITPDFHWDNNGIDHILTATADKIDILSFWTKGGSPSVIYSSVFGQNFAS